MADTKGKKKQIRFSGSTPMPALFLKYEDIGIDLKGDTTPINDEDSEFFKKPADKKQF